MAIEMDGCGYLHRVGKEGMRNRHERIQEENDQIGTLVLIIRGLLRRVAKLEGGDEKLCDGANLFDGHTGVIVGDGAPYRAPKELRKMKAENAAAFETHSTPAVREFHDSEIAAIIQTTQTVVNRHVDAVTADAIAAAVRAAASVGAIPKNR